MLTFCFSRVFNIYNYKIPWDPFYWNLVLVITWINLFGIYFWAYKFFSPKRLKGTVYVYIYKNTCFGVRVNEVKFQLSRANYLISLPWLPHPSNGVEWCWWKIVPTSQDVYVNKTMHVKYMFNYLKVQLLLLFLKEHF